MAHPHKLSFPPAARVFWMMLYDYGNGWSILPNVRASPDGVHRLPHLMKCLAEGWGRLYRNQYGKHLARARFIENRPDERKRSVSVPVSTSSHPVSATGSPVKAYDVACPVVGSSMGLPVVEIPLSVSVLLTFPAERSIDGAP